MQLWYCQSPTFKVKQRNLNYKTRSPHYLLRVKGMEWQPGLSAPNPHHPGHTSGDPWPLEKTTSWKYCRLQGDVIHGLHAKKFEMFSCLLIRGHGFLEALRLTIPFCRKTDYKDVHFWHPGRSCRGSPGTGWTVCRPQQQTGALVKICTDKSDNWVCLDCRQGLEEASHTRLYLHTTQSRAHCQVGGSLGILSWRWDPQHGLRCTPARSH